MFFALTTILKLTSNPALAFFSSISLSISCSKAEVLDPILSCLCFSNSVGGLAIWAKFPTAEITFVTLFNFKASAMDLPPATSLTMAPAFLCQTPLALRTTYWIAMDSSASSFDITLIIEFIGSVSCFL